jgi:hypothetical protein
MQPIGLIFNSPAFQQECLFFLYFLTFEDKTGGGGGDPRTRDSGSAIDS